LARLLLDRSAIERPRPDLWPEGIDELEAYEYDLTEMGNVGMNAPSGQHDDCVIALALAVWQFEYRMDRIRQYQAVVRGW
jgi:hypothetical protein